MTQPCLPEVEICAETLQACVAAEQGGADRIELCAALSEGGVTPSRGLLRGALQETSLPVHVLLRPRLGNFVYTEPEFQAIRSDLEDLLETGAAGCVIGCLTEAATVAEERLSLLVGWAHGKPVTFHRAFDQLANPSRGLEAVVRSGCARVLSSGGKPTVEEGLQALQALAAQANRRIRLAAGGGLTLALAAQLARIGGIDLHASLRSTPPTSSAADPLWRQTHAGYGEIDVDHVRALVAAARSPAR